MSRHRYKLVMYFPKVSVLSKDLLTGANLLTYVPAERKTPSVARKCLEVVTLLEIIYFRRGHLYT